MHVYIYIYVCVYACMHVEWMLVYTFTLVWTSAAARLNQYILAVPL